MPSRAPNITIREREETELFTLWTGPQIHSHPAAPPGQQLSRFTSSFRFVWPWNRHQFTLYAQSWFWRTGELLSPQPELHEGKKSAGRRKGTQSRACHTFILIARSWTGLSEPCPERRQWKAKGAPGAPRRRRAAAERAGGRGKVWPLPPLRPPDWFIPADRPWATAESFMTSPSRWAESSSLTPRLRDAAKSSNQLEGDHRCERLKLPINRPFKTKENLCFFFFVSPRLKLNLCCVQDLPVKQEQRRKAGWLALTSTSKDIPVFLKMYLFFKSWWVRFDSLLDRCVWKPFFSQKETYVNLYNEVGMINITLT